ncbi:hypothetical protein A6J71_25235 [Enterobacter cancerogenus]|uniref:hypothetical protein n=1 Tax=Enterobacter cancerogenus TaxID=69218 RepID=UPI000C9D15CE|nr:hypothetical protein [Enterobacter cancerogenus]PNF13243.1 hypothetical protein A6J71_25235 [Enterobacter cancerogenus]
MELNPFHRLCDWITWVTTSIGVSVGVMTWNEKIGSLVWCWVRCLAGAHGYIAPALKGAGETQCAD